MEDKVEMEEALREKQNIGNIEIINYESEKDPGEYWVKIDGEWVKRDSKDGVVWPLVGISNCKKKGVFIQLDVGSGTPKERKVFSAQKRIEKRNNMQMAPGKEFISIMLWIACVASVAVIFVAFHGPQILTSSLNWTIVLIAPILACFMKVLKGSNTKPDSFVLALEDHARISEQGIKKQTKMEEASGDLVWTKKKKITFDNGPELDDGFTNAGIEGSRMESSIAYDSRMGGSQMRGSRMEGSRMGGSRMGGSRTEGSRMGGSKMEGSRLAGSRMVGSRMGGSRMGGSRMEGSRMGGSALDKNYR